MGGGLLQLIAVGAQDAYLTTNPQITFWKGLYKRHTNFAMEPFRINLTGMPAWGTKQSATIGRHADLISSTYLEVVLPAQNDKGETIIWNNEQGRLGYMMLQYVDLEIGGQLIDRLYSEWMYLWETLSSDRPLSFKRWQTVGRQLTAGAVTLPSPTDCSQKTGRPAHPNVFYVPLNFFYTKTPGLALPLIALQYHEVKVNIQWSPTQTISGSFASADIAKVRNPTSAALYVDYIYLDVDERRRMAQESQEYLIEQVQFNEDKGITSANARIDLTFNHPVKELVWVVQPERFTNCKIADANWVSSTTSFDGVPRPQQVSRLTPFTYDYANQLTVNNTDSKTSQSCTQPVFEQWLQFNGQDRLDKRNGEYFNKVQPMQFHTGTMKPEGFDDAPIKGSYVSTKPSAQKGIYTYSFALKPEEHQPSGTCNFSRIDTATLVLTMSGDYVVNEDNAWNVRVYAINYNVLRIMSGMAGLSYSN